MRYFPIIIREPPSKKYTNINGRHAVMIDTTGNMLQENPLVTTDVPSSALAIQSERMSGDRQLGQPSLHQPQTPKNLQGRAANPAFPQRTYKSPWRWISVLFLTKGVISAVMMYAALVLFKRMGVNNSSITFFTAWLMLPLVLRPILTIFVQPGRRNKTVILLSEILAALSVAGVAYSLEGESWLEGALFFFWSISIIDIFNDIATDKYCVKTVAFQYKASVRTYKLLFYRLAMLVVLGILMMIGGNLEVITRSVSSSWSITFYLASGIILLLVLVQAILLPRFRSTNRERKVPMADMFYAFLNTNADLIRTPRSWPGGLFLALFLVPLALLSRISILFFLDLGSSGGLSLSPQELGLTQGTIGVFGTIAGFVAGEKLIRRFGQRKMLLFMAAASTIPGLIYIHLSYALPDNLSWISLCSFVQQVAFGFSFCGYYHFMIYYCEVKQFSTYSLCKGLTALAIMIPVMVSGSMQQTMGYRMFFIFVTISSLITMIVSLIVMADHDLGKKNKRFVDKNGWNNPRREPTPKSVAPKQKL